MLIVDGVAIPSPLKLRDLIPEDIIQAADYYESYAQAVRRRGASKPLQFEAYVVTLCKQAARATPHFKWTANDWARYYIAHVGRDEFMSRAAEYAQPTALAV